MPDGFFDSLSSLKCPDMTKIQSSESYSRFNLDYETIVKICQAGIRIPEISGEKAVQILYDMKADVNDLYSITASTFESAS